MIGLGTLIDVTLILLGGFAGLAFGRFISERIQDTLLKATAVAIIFIGINLIWPKTFRVANMLPAVVVAMAAAFVM